MKSKITQVKNDFDNIYRIKTEEFLVDILSKKEPNTGDTIEYEFNPDKKEKGKILNGRIFQIANGKIYVSFGGMMGWFVTDKVYEEEGKFSFWYSLT